MTRGSSLAGLLVPALIAATAAADPPVPADAPAPPAAPVVAAPAAPPVAKPPPPPVRAAKPPKPKEPELPSPEVNFRLIARSAEGLWTMRLENEGPSPVRVPADARLIQLTIENGDTLSKKGPKPVTCKLPGGLRPDGFPEPRALLLAPGEAYVENFDPRLFCFGKDSKALAGGAIVRARFGWDAPKGAKKIDPPYAVESTELPSIVAPQKNLFAPPIVLSYAPPEVDESMIKPDDKNREKDDESPSKDDKDAKDKDGKDKEVPVVDEHAAKIELTANPYADAQSGFRVAITVKATNAGHRPTLLAARSRMAAFRIDGPDGVLRCGAVNGQTRAISRDGYRQMKPGASTSLTVIVEEACGRPVFRRPGLYRVLPSLRLTETGAELGLAAYTGVARAKEPTLVRVATGHDPYHASPPKVEKPAKPDDAPTP